MKKIIVFLNAYSQGISGADKICIETWKHLDEKHVTVMTSHEGKKMCDNFGLKARFVITTSEQAFHNSIQTYLKRIIFGIWNAITSSHQDIIYSSSDQLPDILPALIFKLKKRDTQWIVRSYHVIPKKRLISYLAQRLSFFILNIFKVTIITASTLMENELRQNGFSSEHIRIIYPGISVPKMLKKGTTNQYNAVFMSRLHESKGIFDLIDIWKKVIKKMPNASLKIIGTGEKQTIQKLYNLIKINNLESSITLLGYQTDLCAQQIISESSIFVFPSHEEGFSLTIAEVLLLGIPIIAYDLPIYSDIFPHVLTTVSKYDIDAFSNKIYKLIQQPSSVKKSVAKGIQIASQFTWDQAIETERALLDL